MNTPASLGDTIPTHLGPLLPQNGGVFVSGGFMSAGRMVIFDLDTKRVTLVEGHHKNVAANPETDAKTKQLLTDEEGAELEHLSLLVLLSPQLFINQSPTADFDTLLVLRRDGLFRTIQSYGPPVSYVKDLYDFLWGFK